MDRTRAILIPAFIASILAFIGSFYADERAKEREKSQMQAVSRG